MSKARTDVKIGNKYKHWTVINGPVKNKHNSMMWEAECDCKQSRKWFQANALTDPTRCFKCIKCSQKENIKNLTTKNGRVGNLTQSRFSKLQRCAKARNLEFNLTKEYLWKLFENQKQLCAITGEYIDDIKNASLDRINSAIPYIEGNVQWVTVQANRSKHIMSMSKLIEFCQKVLNHANQQPSQS